MTRVILIRHGHSIANFKKIFAGHTDYDLHESGIVQAKQTAKYIFDNYKVDKIYSSDLKRAYNTVKELSLLTGLDITTDKGFRELYIGDIENMLNAEFEANYPEDIIIWRTDIDNIDFRKFNGENIPDLTKRFYDTVEKVAKENDGKTIVIGTHATAIRTFIAKVMGISVQEYPWPLNASVTVAEYNEGKFELTLTNYNEHLEEVKKPTIDGV